MSDWRPAPRPSYLARCERPGRARRRPPLREASSVAKDGAPLADPLPQRRGAGEPRVRRERPLVELAGAEADRADEQLPALVLVLLEEAGERGAAVAGDGVGVAGQREPDSLLGEEHGDLPALLG